MAILNAKNSELAEAMAAYLRDARKRFDECKLESPDTLEDPVSMQKWFTEVCENRESWQILTDVWSRTFDRIEDHGVLPNVKAGRLHYWMRRRGIYQGFIDESEVDPRKVTEWLIEDSERTEEEIVYLIILYGVEFSQRMKFKYFDIFKPNAEELESILDMPTNRLFFEQGATSTHRLDDHWYLLFKVKQTHSSKRESLKHALRRSLRPTFSTFEPVVEDYLKLFALWDWRRFDEPEFEGKRTWEGMPEPLVIRRSNDPFTWPEFAPDIKRLRYEIIGWDERNNALTRPLIRWAFDQEETAAFEQFLATKADQLATIRRIGEAWHFLDRALNFLLKACFTFGVEQLLWHTVAIEALLGEDRQGLVSQLKRRIAVVYPGDAGRKKRAAKVFDQDVYDLRSKLVHGGELREADRKDLRNARILARTIAVRMIEMLASLGAMIETKKLQALPSRVDVLESLDQIAEKREMALHPLAQAVSSALP